MSKKTSAPKRAILRTMRFLLNVNGTTSDITIRSAGDPVTIIRNILQGGITSEAVGATARKLFVELWRKDNSTGTVLPTQVIASSIPYADNQDLLWAGIFGIMRETTSEGGGIDLDLDMKGMRKLGRSEDYIARFAGDSAVVLNALLTTFYKET